jgi:hypothetical protein
MKSQKINKSIDDNIPLKIVREWVILKKRLESIEQSKLVKKNNRKHVMINGSLVK